MALVFSVWGGAGGFGLGDTRLMACPVMHWQCVWSFYVDLRGADEYNIPCTIRY